MKSVEVLPALRGLMVRENVLPRLSRVEAEGSEPVVSLPEGCADVVAELRQQLPEGAACVTVADLGTYRAVYDAPAGRASGKVAVVTGGAQGFGFEIAADLAQQGAYVALADINAEGVNAAAEKINALCGRAAACGVGVNVADLESVNAALEAVVARFGGVDVFVSNAGVLRAGSVKDLSVKDLDFVTSVNYKGYFLCVKAVAPIMALQHRAAPGRWCDIIQVNSKSGLVGSNKNGAYAGSKFGGIGLTQSFAMELVEDGIKVNAVCPGNFYDGPLWSHPETGLFRQYLDSGKVPGAKTFEDVKHFYESKVPMRRGCTTPDVMKAIYYLMDQAYETGQAMPVTGGQVMLA
jgi:sorbitol-6-phosphate 2-dehydrogenase